MASMFFQFSLYLVGGSLLAYLVYALFLSGGSDKKGEPKLRRRLERREEERGDRRKSNRGSPDGQERRKGPRRN